MPLELTPEQARALGIDVPVVKKPRQTRKALPGHGVSTCCTCNEVFTTTASEDRHVKATLHPRYASEWT